MYARTIDDAALRLRELRHQEWQDLGLGALTFGLSLIATKAFPSLALPLFLGGAVVWILGLRALIGRWSLVDSLADEQEAYVLPEVRDRAAREATMERRRSFAAIIRSGLGDHEAAALRFGAAIGDLEALASELEDEGLALEPASAVACFRLLSDPEGSPFLNPALPAELLRSRTMHVRDGFSGPGP